MHRTTQSNIMRFVILGIILAGLAVMAVFLRELKMDTPKVPLGRGVESALDWAIIYLSPVLAAIKLNIGRIFLAAETAFLWLPWPIWVLLVGVLGWSLASLRTGLLVAVALSVVQAVGLWDEAMSTLSLIGISVILALIVAIPIGIIAAKNNFFESIIRPLLDAMQTIPSMVYLIPAVMLLGVGRVPAAVATMIFAVPPAIRLTNLGMRQVSAETKEAAISFGASPWQLLTKVELPLAARTIMAGVNQSTMMAVSMVVIAAFIGAGGLGYSVLFALNRVQVGNGFEAGLAILAIAIILDRLTQALSRERQPEKRSS
ncbi:MAG: ABC transporter permease subunit [Dehalococcoidales bacterium]|nr:ABC transporter permease subunit [Dehalococcoidales bacterium]